MDKDNHSPAFQIPWHTVRPQDVRPSLVAESDTSEIEALRESESERAKRLQIYVSEGIMSTDEARAELGLPAL